MLGVLINVMAVIAGSILGLVLGRKVSNHLQDTVMQILGLCVLVIGICNGIKTENVLCVIICASVGGLLGAAMRLENKLEKLGEKSEKLFNQHSQSGNFARGFVTATLTYCVGAMAVVGSLESGISGNHSTLIAKSMIDGISSIFFAAALGPGVILSAVGILLYQGVIALCGQWIAPYLAENVINEMTAVGGLLIIGLGINMLKLGKIQVGNMLPAIFLPIVYYPVVDLIAAIF